MARALVATQLLTDEEATAIWEALALLDVVADSIGLDPWDHAPQPAPEGLQRAAVATGAVTEIDAAVMTTAELDAAMAAA